MRFHEQGWLYASHMVNNEKSKKILQSLNFIKISTSKIFFLFKQIEEEDINYELVKS